MTSRGWAVLLFGKSGRVTSVELVPEDGGRVTQSLREGIGSGATIRWADERRHDANVYVPYAVEGDELKFLGPGLVSLPGCGHEHCV